MASTLNMIDPLIVRLTGALPACDVLHFAGAATSYAPLSATGTVLLAYQGSLFSATADCNYLVQSRTMRFAISVLSPHSQGSAAALTLLDRVRQATLGLRLPDCQQTRAVREEYLGETQAHWVYRLELEADSLWMEDREAEHGPSLVNVQYVAD